ncbi:hypothetical protein BCV70DRAFT_209303 [Testicularia cyperi]|uniref:Peptide hydrolase n=1 Tax=Testicularia cyperi TaxID=1882483 RepID=A0A317XWU2_9BASI|nr:hypothetical protein BCV70DRAFT_209303 [Testicularia cyperi]
MAAVVSLCVSLCSAHAERSQRRDYGRLTDAALASIAGASDPAKYLDVNNPDSLLSRILIPRPPDTENSRKVQKAILDVFRNELGGSSDDSSSFKIDWTKSNGKLGWHIDTHTFETDTPEGKKKMTNLILTKNPSAPRKFVVAAHYDSKFFTQGSGMSGFVGATDSAAPCAMMVDLAVALDDALDARERRLHANQQSAPTRAQETTLQLVFFDGEEAYRTWTHTDSIYGSRELANLWTNSFWDPATFDAPGDDAPSSEAKRLQTRRYRSSYTPVKHMNTIEHMVLLDLLGAPNPTVPSYFESTKWLHEAMTDAESRLRTANLLWPASSSSTAGKRSFFTPHKAWGGIEDDHLPFLHSGVHVLHVIPSPFPLVWHKMSDDRTALDYPTMYAWCMILRLTVAEYLGLDIPSAKRHKAKVRHSDTRFTAMKPLQF